jgi:cytochrome c oxidase subunit 3
MGKTYTINNQHFWHIVTQSPWPLVLSFVIFGIPTSLIVYLQGYHNGSMYALFCLIAAICVLFIWFRDIIRESSFEGFHTLPIQRSLIASMLLFIFSEVMFFVAFFWSFFHSSISPTVELGLQWPPVGMAPFIFSPWDIPLLNTLILLLSGVTITLSHLYIKEDNLNKAVEWIAATLFLAVLFLSFQYFEYSNAGFDITDGIYGTTFFLCTGFHGFHVIIGTIFIFVCAIRLYIGHYSPAHHFGFEAAAWYWHFVDVVWLFLFTMIYYWGYEMVYPTINAFEI